MLSEKEMLKNDLRQDRAAYLEACLDWASHPCPAHLYNLELFKHQLAQTYDRIKRAGLMSEIIMVAHPEPVFASQIGNEDDDRVAVKNFERSVRHALVSTAVAVLTVNEHGWLTTSALSVQAFRALFEALHKSRRRLLELGVAYPRGFSPGGCQIRDADSAVLRVDTLVNQLLQV